MRVDAWTSFFIYTSATIAFYIAANTVSPANAFANAWPKRIE